MSSESEVQQRVQIEAARHGVLLMRNNSGALKDKDGRLVRYGLGNISSNQETKSSDLIGIATITVTPQMVGQKVGVFVAIEMKHPDWNPNKKFDERETHQLNFLEWVRSKGGIAGFSNSIDSFIGLLKAHGL